MAGKALTQTDSSALAYAIDHLTKNQMADVLIDLARRQIGDEMATDEAIMATLQQWIDPILVARSDVAIGLATKHQKFTTAARKYSE